MTIEGMTGERVPMAVLEKETGFRPGYESWAFGAMLALAKRGLYVRSVEDFDPELFVADPRAAIMAQVHDTELVDRAFEVSDVAGQVEVVRACLQKPRVTFETKVPSLEDVRDALGAGGTLIVNVNAKALNSQDGYSGHLVVVHNLQSEHLVIEDPGPPAKHDYEVELDHFERAWREPSEGLANLLAITPEPWKPKRGWPPRAKVFPDSPGSSCSKSLRPLPGSGHERYGFVAQIILGQRSGLVAHYRLCDVATCRLPQLTRLRSRRTHLVKHGLDIRR